MSNKKYLKKLNKRIGLNTEKALEVCEKAGVSKNAFFSGVFLLLMCKTKGNKIFSMDLFQHTNYTGSLTGELLENATLVDMLKQMTTSKLEETEEQKAGIRGTVWQTGTADTSDEILCELMIQVEENGHDDLLVQYHYSSELYEEEEMDILHLHFQTLLTAIMEDPKKLVLDYDIVSEKEKTLLAEVNQTDYEFSKDACVHEIIENTVKKFPNKTALVYEGEEITFEEFNRRANCIAALLKKKNIQSGDYVAIMAARGVELICSIFGVLKSGAAYVPMNPIFPIDRLRYMMQDSQAKMILTTGCPEELGEFCPIVDLNDSALYEGDAENPVRQAGPDDTLCLIYTSGTTGMPKSVRINHGAIVNYCEFNAYDFLKLNEHDRVPQFAPITFSTAISEITTTLLSGATLYLLTDEKIKNIPLFNQFLHDIQATMCLLPPIYCDYVQLPDSVRMVETGGSACHKEAAERMVAQGAKYYNAYGLSEGTVVSVWEHQQGEEVKKIPIGKPVANTKVYIMNDNKVNGLYMPGELCVTGMAVSGGYLNLTELNEKRFVANPFGDGKMLKTGDIVQWNHKGELEYVGRSDNQVQIRGMRVELEEIEHSLLKDPAIINVAAISKEDNQRETSIAAFVTSKEQLDIPALKKQLRQRLVDYMIPANIIQLETLPLTVNGKVDRQTLATIPIEESTSFVALETETEKQIAAFFEKIVKAEKVGRQTDFFEAGGHSLRLTRLLNAIEAAFSVRLSVSDIYEHSTVEAIGAQIDAAGEQEIEMIPVAEERAFYPLSSAQKQIYIATALDDTGKSYNVPVSLAFSGLLDTDRLTSVFQQLITRHDSLRTVFKTIDGQPVQVVQQNATAAIEAETVAVLSDEVITQGFNAFVRPFDLETAPLMRMKVLSDSEKSVLFVDVHHIISDGGSFNTLLGEISALYGGHTLAPLTVQYKDFSEWQKKQDLEKQKQFWLEQFKDVPESLDLPVDYKRTARQSFEGKTVKQTIPTAAKEGLAQLAQRTGTTEYMVLLSVCMIMLGKYSRQEDVVVGTSISGRTRQEIENVQGIFVNTLAMRGRPQADKTLLQFLQEIKESSLQAYQNQEFPFDELVGELDIPRDLSRNPLFDVMFVLQNNEQPEQRWGDLAIESANMEEQGAKFDLTFSISETTDGYELSLDYRTALFKEVSMEQMLQHYITLLQNAANDEAQLLAQLSAVDIAEQKKIQTVFNDSNKISDYNNQAIAEIFEKQAAAFPNKPAVIYKDQVLTYQQLNEKANNLAAHLKAADVKANDFVAVEAKREPSTIVGILGIVKAGAAYVPIDPDYPENRITYMLNDCGSKVLLASDAFSKQLADASIPLLSLDEIAAEKGIADNPTVVNKEDDLLYLMYTSGTTGKPKGTMIEHRNVFHLLESSEPVGLSNSTIMLQAGSLSFDAATFEIWGSLLKGGSLILTEKESFMNSQLLKQTIETHAINTMFLTTALFNQHIEIDPHVFDGLESLLFGGEKLSERHVGQLLEVNQTTSLLHVYGPTEGTTFSEYHLIHQDDLKSVVPIGKPFPTTTAYILSDEGELCGIGMKGELCVGGTGVARGYWQNAELTDKVFIDSPFGRLYRTGDLAKWCADGSIDFLGRVDDQIKLRGFRVELEEITNTILNATTIQQAVTILTAEKKIAVYVADAAPIDLSALKEQLRKQLPEYMLPDLLLQLAEMPVTPTGKIDRSALPIILEEAEEEGIAPRNELEAKVASVFSEVLGRRMNGVKTNFFDQGGHSLKAMQLLNKLEAVFTTRIPLKDFFEEPTVENVSRKISSSSTIGYERIQKAAVQETYPASSTQTRLYVIHEFDETGIAYNVPVGLSFEQAIDQKQVEQSFHQLIKKHEALRTSFYTGTDGIVYQKIAAAEDNPFALETGELKDESDLQKLLTNFVQPFDLSEGPLFRVKIVHTPTGGSLLLMDIHHIVADGLSVQILLKEFAELYNGGTLSTQELQYKDYSEWLSARSMEDHAQFWKSELSGELPILELPLDHRRPQKQSFAGETLSTRISEPLKHKLAALAKQTGTTEYMILLAAYQILLHKYSRQEEIVVGTSVSGRTHADVEAMVGMFVNTLVLKARPEKQKSFTAFLEEIKEQNLQMLEHQEFPFEKIVDMLELPRSLSRNPLFDVMFVYQNQQEEAITLGGSKGKELEVEGTVAKFDLSFRFTETATDYQLIIEYAKDLFKAESIEFMLSHYLVLLEDAVDHSEKAIKDLILINEQEKHVLDSFQSSKKALDLNQTVVSSFEQQVQKYAEQPAVVYGTQQLSYGELNERANQVAHYLRSIGTRPDDLIALIADRSIEMIVSMMGVIKAGGAYVPIDPQAPEERRRYLLTDCQPKVVLTTLELPQELYGIPVVSAKQESFNTFKTDNLEHVNQSNDLLYCIYTSGTTGKPKGVLVEHKGVLNAKQFFSDSLELTGQDQMLQFSNYIFDASVLEIFTALLNGSALHLVDEEQLKNPSFIEKYLSEHISFAILPPQYAASINIKDVDTVMTGGSVATRKIVSEESGNTIGHYLNAYGPTEATVYTTSWSYKKTAVQEDTLPEQLSVGKPITNVDVFIMEDRQLCGVGVVGELCISGVSLARGYLNKPVLTAAAFIDNPFGEGKLYRSGDLARWNADGNLEYMGRIDEQVKIRGYRIEPGEIESILRGADFIKDAAVIVTNVDSNPQLAAYFVSDDEIDLSGLQKYLGKQLPEYMIPDAIMQLSEIPTTPNGKLDKKALPVIKLGSAEALVQPETPMEEQLVQVFKDVLGLSEIGTNQHFLALGGDSIKAIRIAAKIRENGLDILVKDILQYSTIKQISKHVQSTADNGLTAAQAEQSGITALSAAQKLLLNDPLLENHVLRLGFNQKIDEQRLTTAFEALRKHHDVLRTIFTEEHQEIVPVADAEAFHIKTTTLDSTSNSEILTQAEEEMKRAAQTNKGQLLSGHFLHFSDKDHLVVGISPLIADEKAVQILLEDLIAAYSSLEEEAVALLPEKTLPFHAWVETSTSQQLVVAVDIESRTPSASSRKQVQQSYQKIDFVSQLEQANQAFSTTTEELMLTALTTALDEIGQNNREVLIESDGRIADKHALNIIRTVGQFTELEALQLSNNSNMTETILETKEQRRRVQKADKEKVIELAKPIRFRLKEAEQVFLDTETEKLFSETVETKQLYTTIHTALELSVVFSDTELQLNVDYLEDTVTAEQIHLFHEAYEKAVLQVIGHCLNQEEAFRTAEDFEVFDMEADEIDLLNTLLD